MSFLDAIVKKWGATGKKYEHTHTAGQMKDIVGIRFLKFSDKEIKVTNVIFDPVETMTILNSELVFRRIALVLLATDTPSVDNGDGTYTHTYMTHQLRYIDPRMTHTQDDRQAKPL